MRSRFSRAGRATGLLVACVAGLVTAAPASAVSGGTGAADGAYRYTAKLDIGPGVRACSGVLVDSHWVLTAGTCFPENGGQDGPPVQPTTVTVGRTDLSGGDGQIVAVARLVFRADRNLTLARLAVPVSGVAPVKIGTTAPAQDDVLRIAGYGRTTTEWVPNRLHTAEITVNGLTATTLNAVGRPAATVSTCRGDAGGPTIRESGTTAELVAIHSASWQTGCLGETETRQGIVETRVDNLDGWLESRMLGLVATPAPRNAITLGWLRASAPGDTSYRVYGSASPDVPMEQANLLGTTTATSFTHTALAPKQTWHYRVVPVIGGQDGPASAVASATTALPTTSDFNGDKKDDAGAFYDYGNARTSLFTWEASATGFGNPTTKWSSSPGGWAVDRSRFVSGDFNGDGRTDVGAFYDYSDARTGLFVWEAKADGFTDATMRWQSSPGGWAVDRSRFVSGDFNGDGRTDLGAFYDYSNGNTTLFVWEATPTGFGNPTAKWSSGPGGWDAARSRFVTGDFTGDGRVDIGAFYDYGGANTSLFVLEATATGFTNPTQRWASGPGGWAVDRSRFVTGDFNGDGRSDVGALYDYGNAQTGLFVWDAKPGGFTDATRRWLSSPGGWAVDRSRFVTGDYNGDGRTDVGAFYDYSNSHTSLFTMESTATGFGNPTVKWSSTPGGWDMARTTVF